MSTAIAGLISVLGTTGIAQWYKSAQANYTAKQVHTVVCILAATIAIAWGFATANPSFWAWLEHAIVLATASIGTYELALGGLFSVLSGNPPTGTPSVPIAPLTPTQ